MLDLSENNLLYNMKNHPNNERKKREYDGAFGHTAVIWLAYIHLTIF